MKKSYEINMIPPSSDQVSRAPSRPAPPPTLMYLIELDPTVSTCMAGGSLPLQMLNVNQDNAHYLIPVQGTETLEMSQNKHLQLCDETQALPSVGSREATIEISTIGTNKKLQNNKSVASTNETSTLYGSHLGDSKSNSSGSEESFEQSLATTERLSMDPLEALTASGVKRPARKYVHLADSVPPSRAVLSLPSALRLHCGRVTARKLLPPARFGPVRGVPRDISSEEAGELVAKAAASSKPIFLMPKGDGFCHIDVSDQEQANWFSLLPLGSARAANVWLQQRDAELWAFSARRLPPRSPLSLGYSGQLARDLRLPPDMPVLQEEESCPESSECGRELAGTHRIPHYPEAYRSNRPRRRYRCKYCAMPFARVFTLKRHMSLHCRSKPTNTDSAVSAQPVAPAAVSPSAPADDERAPSDDSFHHFSGLDFSAALFDADSLLLGQAAHGDPSCTPDIHFPPLDYSKKVEKAATLIKCPHCQLTMSSNMKQRHKRQCVSRGVECACGSKFRDRGRLARHLRARHAPPPAPLKADAETIDSSYKCDQCQNTFKRRGMLVNHLWRVHGAAPHVPLQRRQRHYPCVACPKLYRTAAKRDTHVRTHHPGAECLRAACIESGAVRVEPAACAACPRQYATRAKLLQHVRHKHPLLAPPSKSKTPKQAQKELSFS